MGSAGASRGKSQELVWPPFSLRRMDVLWEGKREGTLGCEPPAGWVLCCRGFHARGLGDGPERAATPAVSLDGLCGFRTGLGGLRFTSLGGKPCAPLYSSPLLQQGPALTVTFPLVSWSGLWIQNARPLVSFGPQPTEILAAYVHPYIKSVSKSPATQLVFAGAGGGKKNPCTVQVAPE